MSFVSVQFLILTSACALLYFVFPIKWRWTVLLSASMVFYWINSHEMTALLVCTSFFTYFIGLWIWKQFENEKNKISLSPEISREEKKQIKSDTKKRAKLILIFGVTVVLGALIYLKYTNFFLETIFNLIPGKTWQPLSLLKPLGISFYTLQALSYMFDIYRKKYPADRNPLKFLLYMSWFPQIVQGPIARFGRLGAQLYEGHNFDYSRFTCGLQLMLWGWIKKMVIADRLAVISGEIFSNYSNYHGLIIFFCVVLSGLQIYTDFSGGVDVAIGFSQILGIQLDKNFSQPYFSVSIEEFWRKWHITLGSWMRDYVFYPLSLSKAFTALSRKTRKIFGVKFGKKLPSFLGMFISFLLVGFWHGPEWKYVAYGIYNGCIIVSGILFSEYYEKMRSFLKIDIDSLFWKIFRYARTFFLVSIGRYFAGAENLKAAFRMMKATVRSCRDLSFIVDGSLLNLGLRLSDWFVLIIAVLILFLVDFLHEKDIHIRDTVSRQFVILRWVFYYAAVLFVLIFGIYGPAYNAADFVYGGF